MNNVPNNNIDQPGGELTRRSFVSQVAKFTALSPLVHFTFLATKAYATSPECPKTTQDSCPGGMPAYDVCDPGNNDPDLCPGELPPSDECPTDGNRQEDLCMTGKANADTCNHTVDPKSDQCESGLIADDECPDKKEAGDVCGSGMPDEDECDPNGTTADGDFCPGGDAMVDTCNESESSVGDDCSPGEFNKNEPTLFAKDNCNSSHTDECTWISDDTCITGTNDPNGAGYADKCTGITGSDYCKDGSLAQDICINNSDYGQYDTCPGGGVEVDTCEENISDDYCLGGTTETDECKWNGNDECSGGGHDVDTCNETDPDVCPGGGDNVDICNDKSPDVECKPAENDHCTETCDSEDPDDGCTDEGDTCTDEDDSCADEDECISGQAEESDGCLYEDECPSQDSCSSGDTIGE